MKRVLALVLALLLIGCAALATSNGFTFRGGVAWGMTAEEVIAIEGNPAYERDREADFDVLEIDDITVGDVEGDLDYYFFNGKLVAAVYAFDFEDSAVSPSVNEEALRQKYGAPAESDFDRWKRLEDILDGEVERRTAEVFLNWALEDGTYIAMAAERDMDVKVGYYDEAALRAIDP